MAPCFITSPSRDHFEKKEKFTQETHGFKSTVIRIERGGVREGREGGERVELRLLEG